MFTNVFDKHYFDNAMGHLGATRSNTVESPSGEKEYTYKNPLGKRVTIRLINHTRPEPKFEVVLSRPDLEHNVIRIVGRLTMTDNDLFGTINARLSHLLNQAFE